MAEKENESRGVALGGALWRCFCQSIRGFEGRRIFEMGIRVRRRAEKSSSSATVAVTGMEARRGWKGRNERPWNREGERGARRRLQRGSIQRWTKVHSHLPVGRGEDAGTKRGLM